MMLWDAATVLPDDMLVKVDRATMHVALEARVPLLDHRVFEFAWRLPTTARITNGAGKTVLRAVLARHVPPALTAGPNMGSDPPIAYWLRGPLRGWADERLSMPPRLPATGSLTRPRFAPYGLSTSTAGATTTTAFGRCSC